MLQARAALPRDKEYNPFGGFGKFDATDISLADYEEQAPDLMWNHRKTGAPDKNGKRGWPSTEREKFLGTGAPS